MVPDATLRIECIKRALTASILPCIPENEKTTQEQFNLIIASLDMLCSQLPYIHSFEVSEVLCLAELLEDMLAIISDIPLKQSSNYNPDECTKAIAECRADASNSLSPTSALQRHSRDLRQYIHELTVLSDQHSEDTFNKVASVIIRFEKDHLIRERSWISSAGFESNPETLLSVANAAVPTVKQAAHQL